MQERIENDIPLEVREKAGQATTRPGGYLMRDNSGQVIYVGKARNLRKRLASYFQRSDPGNADLKVGAMLKSVANTARMPVRTQILARLRFMTGGSAVGSWAVIDAIPLPHSGRPIMKLRRNRGFWGPGIGAVTIS